MSDRICACHDDGPPDAQGRCQTCLLPRASPPPAATASAPDEIDHGARYDKELAATDQRDLDRDAAERATVIMQREMAAAQRKADSFLLHREAALGRAERAEAEAAALRAEVARLTAARDACERQYQAKVEEVIAAENREEQITHLANEKVAAAEAALAALRAEMDEAIDLLRECAPLTEHNSDAPPPHRLCMRCGVDAALASVERGAKP